jgi:hypothetical protein
LFLFVLHDHSLDEFIRERRLFFIVADSAPRQVLIVLEVAFHAQFMRSEFQGRQTFLPVCPTVMAGFAALDFFTGNIVLFLSIRAFAMMTSVTIKPLMGMVGQVGWSRYLFRVNFGSDHYLLRPISFGPGRGKTEKAPTEDQHSSKHSP